MKRILMPVVVIAALSLLPWISFANDEIEQSVVEDQQAVTAFAAVVERNWPRWSLGNESVTKLDLIARIASPEFKGEDAAALVALETYLRKVPAVNLNTAMAIDNPKILTIYKKNVNKLRRVKRVLFANGQPTFELLQQGPPGDCYFFSASGWMARYRPAVIMNSITMLDDGRYRVNFPNGDEAVVTAPTDGELAINDSDSTLQDGLWMSILEKATGTIQQRTIRKSANLPDPTVAIDISGVPIASTVARWSSHEIKKYPLGKRANREKVRKALIRMHQHKSLSTALLLHRPPAKLPFDHVYAIMDFDQATGMVTIWNPWGTDFKPCGPSGPEFGYERKKGIFQLNLDEFIDFYTFLVIEHN